MHNKYKAHPWHGISIGEKAPDEVTVFIEIVPQDTVKYEVDKESGFITIDRPQQYSNVVPANYGFIPRTYCGEKVADLARSNTDSRISSGDHDPLSILVGDKVYQQFENVEDLPMGIKDRIEHYFLTYKNLPHEDQKCEIAYSYGRKEAYRVIETAIEDYKTLDGLA